MVFFKSKIKLDEFALPLLQLHGTIFGINALAGMCKQAEFNFRDEVSYGETVWEWLAFGMCSISVGLIIYAPTGIRQAVTERVRARFYAGLATAGVDHKKLTSIERTVAGSLAEYKLVSNNGPVDGLVVEKIFNRPPGVLTPGSMQAIELRIAIHTRWKGTLDQIEKLFRQLSVVA